MREPANLVCRIATPIVILATCFLSAFSPRLAYAQALVVQRGDTLYTADPTGSAGARKLLALGSPVDSLWSIGPDGRRIATLTRSGDAAGGFNLAARPVTVYVSEVGGRHRKRLFSTDTLRDRLGRNVTTLGLGDDDGKFVDWDVASLSWSADTRTLYISCFAANTGAKATFTVDGASGTALVDAQGRWKSIASLTAVDARGGRVVGTAAEMAQPPATVTRAYERTGPLVTIDLANSTRATLNPAAPPLGADAAITDPALSPDETRIAFSALASGLYVVGRHTAAGRQLVAGNTLHPRWSPDSRSLYFLLQRPGSDTAPVFDLYAIDLPPSDTAAAGAPAPLRLVLQGVDWFDIVPD